MPAPPPSLRASVVRACLLALAAVAGDPAEIVEITIRSNGSTIVYEVTPEEARAVLGPVPVEGLSVLATALRDKLTPLPMTAKKLAREAGYSMGSHVYAALRELEGRSLCQKTTKGYRLPP